MKDAWGKEMTVRPFSNGTQYLDWQASNCDRCTKAATEADYYAGKFPCDIEKELAYAAVGDGTINDEIAARLKPDPESYVWPCGEWEPTEAWKAEYAAKQGKARE